MMCMYMRVCYVQWLLSLYLAGSACAQQKMGGLLKVNVKNKGGKQ